MHNEYLTPKSNQQFLCEARGSFEHSFPSYNRGRELYERLFRCTIADLFAGKRILDLGCGASAALAADLCRTDVTTVSLSPNASTAPHLTPAAECMPVAGMAQRLPFASNTFDGVFASWSVPMYLPKSKAHYGDTFREVHRVLAADGIALFAPVEGHPVVYMDQVLGESVGKDCYHLGEDDQNQVLLVVKDPTIFERPEIDVIKRHIDDIEWTSNNPHPMLLGSYEAFANTTPIGSYTIGKVALIGGIE